VNGDDGLESCFFILEINDLFMCGCSSCVHRSIKKPGRNFGSLSEQCKSVAHKGWILEDGIFVNIPKSLEVYLVSECGIKYNSNNIV
jgi:uncharacterized protein YceK